MGGLFVTKNRLMLLGKHSSECPLIQKLIIDGSIIAVCFKWSVNRFEECSSWFPWGIP